MYGQINVDSKLRNTSSDWNINTFNDWIKEICIRGNECAFYSIEMCMLWSNYAGLCVGRVYLGKFHVGFEENSNEVPLSWLISWVVWAFIMENIFACSFQCLDDRFWLITYQITFEKKVFNRFYGVPSQCGKRRRKLL